MPLRKSRSSLLVGLAFLAIVGGMTLLGLIGMDASRRVGELTSQSMRASTATLAEKIVRKVEKRIIDQDRALFDLVDLRHLEDFKVFWDRLTTMSSLVEGALVLDGHQRVLYYASKESPRERERFTALFSTRILPRLELANLAPGLHKHLHLRLDDRDFLISYLVLVQGGERFLVALKINMAYVLHKMLAEELQALQARYVAAIVDQQGSLVHGRAIPPGLGAHRVARRFPTTLYRWTLELAPRAVASLTAQAERRDQINVLLVLVSLAVAVVGLAMLLWLVRRERALSALRSEFVTTVTHELKTPLSLIRMYAELMTLDRPGAAAKRAEYAGILARETDKLGRLIDNVLDLSRLEQGRALLELRRVDLCDLLRDAVAEHRERPARASAEVTLTLPEEEAVAVVDPDAMRVALLNLMDNAVKYGASAVQVSLSRDRGSFAVAVVDDGPGIPAEERDRLFERFFRGKQALRSRERGSGIGLSLVHLVMEAHRGRVTVGDRQGGGTVFTLHLPAGDPRGGGLRERAPATAHQAATSGAETGQKEEA